MRWIFGSRGRRTNAEDGGRREAVQRLEAAMRQRAEEQDREFGDAIDAWRDRARAEGENQGGPGEGPDPGDHERPDGATAAVG